MALAATGGRTEEDANLDEVVLVHPKQKLASCGKSWSVILIGCGTAGSTFR
jgi:hypothetical protein